MIVAGLDFSASDVAGELHKIRLDRDVAVIGSSLLPNSAGMLVRVLAAGRRRAEARPAPGLVRGKSSY